MGSQHHLGRVGAACAACRPTCAATIALWREAESQQQGQYTVAEVVDLIRAQTLVYVSDDAFERTALVRVVDAKAPYIRSWVHGRWGNDLLVLPRFGA